jgi:predicted lysophospholipase L1 biosynthesis ABC-type transport system permease subunit
LAAEEPRRHPPAGDRAGPVEDRRLTRAELVAGLVRLGILLALVVLAAVVVGLIVWRVSDQPAGHAMSNGFAIVGALVLVFAVGSWMRTGPLRRDGLGARLADEHERRESERLALGLAAAGLGLVAVGFVLA